VLQTAGPGLGARRVERRFHVDSPENEPAHCSAATPGYNPARRARTCMPHLAYHLAGQPLTYPLDGERVKIGRSPDNDLVLAHARVSRHHAVIERRGRGWRVRDLGSSNGTRLNGEDAIDRDLRHGDRIQLHQLVLTFVDDSGGGFELTGSRSGAPALEGTVFRSAVDFSLLASLESVHDPAVSLATGAGRLGRLLQIVTRASEALLASTSLDQTLATVLDLAFAHLSVERGCILLWDEARGDLTVRCLKHKAGADAEGIRFSRTIAEKVFRERVAVLTSDAQSDSRFAGGESIVALGIRSAMAAPLWSGDHVEGLIYVDTPLQAKAFDRFDLDVLSALGNHAAVAIAHARLQASVLEQQLARRRLERYHSPAVIERITAHAADGRIDADELDVTVLFADVVGFTERCEKMEPREVAELLNRYLSEMAEVVFRHSGTLDKFIGDCLMAVFGAPIPAAEHPRLAAEAALDMREALAALNHPLPEASRLQFRVGLHSGRVVAGDIGSARRSDYTVLGSTVNLAARLESSVAQPGQIVVSETTRARLGGAFATRFVGDYQPRGFSTPVACHELVGRTGPGTAGSPDVEPDSQDVES